MNPLSLLPNQSVNVCYGIIRRQEKAAAKHKEFLLLLHLLGGRKYRRINKRKARKREMQRGEEETERTKSNEGKSREKSIVHTKFKIRNEIYRKYESYNR